MAGDQLLAMPTTPSTPHKPSLKRSTAYLDGLRGLAAYLVFVQHYGGGFDFMAHEAGFGENGNYLITTLPFLRIFLTGGNPAVPIFFVLSGYVLSQSPLKLLRKDGHPRSTKMSLLSAVIRRPIRLFVPCVMIGLFTALCMHLPGGPYSNGPFVAKEYLGEELVNWAYKSVEYFNPFKPEDVVWYHYGMVMWTIPLEYKGSMLVFAALVVDAFVNIEARYTVALEFAGMIICMVTGYWSMACFLAGLVLAYNDICGLDEWLLERITTRGKAIFLNILFVIGWYLLCQPAGFGGLKGAGEIPGWRTLTLIIPPWYDDHTFFRWWHSWGAIFLVYTILRLEWLQRFFTTRLLQYLGRISFMLYLVHIPFVWSIGGWIRCALGTCTPEEDTLTWKDKMIVKDIGPAGLSSRFLIAMTLMTIICVPVAEMFVRILDVPVVKFGRWFTAFLGLENRRGKVLEEREGHASQPLLGDMSEIR